MVVGAYRFDRWSFLARRWTACCLSRTASKTATVFGCWPRSPALVRRQPLWPENGSLWHKPPQRQPHRPPVETASTTLRNFSVFPARVHTFPRHLNLRVENWPRLFMQSSQIGSPTSGGTRIATAVRDSSFRPPSRQTFIVSRSDDERIHVATEGTAATDGGAIRRA